MLTGGKDRRSPLGVIHSSRVRTCTYSAPCPRSNPGRPGPTATAHISKRPIDTGLGPAQLDALGGLGQLVIRPDQLKGFGHSTSRSARTFESGHWRIDARAPRRSLSGGPTEPRPSVELVETTAPPHRRLDPLAPIRAFALRVERLATSQHVDVLLDPPGSRLLPLGGTETVQYGKAVLAGEILEHRLRLRPRG